MLKLYYKPSCGYCQRVLSATDGMRIELALHDVSNDETAASELTALGGKMQVPFLVDEEHHVSMYESEDIVAYLERTYAKTTR